MLPELEQQSSKSSSLVTSCRSRLGPRLCIQRTRCRLRWMALLSTWASTAELGSASRTRSLICSSPTPSLTIWSSRRTMKMNQDLYTWYHASAKKLGSKERKAKELDEKSFQIAGMHGIRWQEAGNRATVSVLKQWKTICSDLYQHAQELAGVQLNLESDPSVFIGLPVFYDFEVEGGRTRRYKGRVTEHLGCNTQGQEEFTLHFRYQGGEEMKTTQAELLGAFLREDHDKGSGTMKGFSSTPPGASLDHSAL